jgi:hypothetical protein
MSTECVVPLESAAKLLHVRAHALRCEFYAARVAAITSLADFAASDGCTAYLANKLITAVTKLNTGTMPTDWLSSIYGDLPAATRDAVSKLLQTYQSATYMTSAAQELKLDVLLQHQLPPVTATINS